MHRIPRPKRRTKGAGLGPFFLLLSILVTCNVDPAHACKFSVRDVAFVNIHDSSWQLVAVQPENVDSAQLERWQAEMDRALRDSNVDYHWIAADSAAAEPINRLYEATTDPKQPRIAIFGHDERVRPVWPNDFPQQDFQDTLRSLVQSPIRDRILDQVASALCILVVADGSAETESLHSEIHDMVRAAAKSVSQQMWMLDKAAKNGPQVVMIRADQQPQEQWLLWSLGIDPNAETTSVAIVYGQGRCLGQPVSAADLTESRLVQLAALCGRNCECDLDRRWLYGQQMLHRWSEQRAFHAESQLDFDPRSAMVVAEISRILPRNTGRQTSGNGLPPVSGLVIHDLDSLAPTAPMVDPDSALIDRPEINNKTLNRSTEGSPVEDVEPVVGFKAPGLIIGALGLIVLLTGIYVSRKTQW